MRELEGVLGLCGELATAASRWRPREGSGLAGVAWLGCGGSSARQQEGEELRGDAWVTAHGELMAGKAGKALHGGDGRRCRRREAEQG